MSEMSLSPPDKQTLSQDATTWAERAKGCAITSTESCRNASYLLRSIKGVRSDIQRWFEPHIDAAMATKRQADVARKALVDECTRMEAPLIDAEATLKTALLAWERHLESQRVAEERRLQAEAQAHAEAMTLEAAAALEREAMATGDTGMLAEAHEVLSQPIDAPVVHVQTQAQKVQGIVYRDQWKAHPEIDVKALAAAVGQGIAPETFVLPNLSAINAFARATQGTQTIAGVRFFNDRQIAARG